MVWLRNRKTDGWFEIPDEEYYGYKEKQIAENAKQGGVKNIEQYAKEHNDIFLSNKLLNNFNTTEIKNMVDKVDEMYKEFGIDSSDRSSQLVFTLSADENLEDNFATASVSTTGVLKVNPLSKYLRENNFTNIYHEVGHLIDLRITQKLLPHSDANTNDSIANRMCLEAKNNLKRSYPNLSDYVSNYGLTNSRELIADSVRDYMINKESAQPMSLSVVRILKKYVNKAGLGTGGNTQIVDFNKMLKLK